MSNCQYSSILIRYSVKDINPVQRSRYLEPTRDFFILRHKLRPSQLNVIFGAIERMTNSGIRFSCYRSFPIPGSPRAAFVKWPMHNHQCSPVATGFCVTKNKDRF